LRPFQRRLYRQRIVVGLLRILAAALVVAIGLMLLRVFGVALPMPLPIPMPMLVAPLAGAGVVLLAGLVVLLRQRPDPARMAHALDSCLGLREQIGSALELSDDEARQSDMAARLRLRAEATLRDVPPTRVLPWPSTRWERRSLIGLALLAAGAALLAAHAPNPGNPNGQQLAASRDRAHTGSPARPARANPTLGRPPGALIGVISLGNATLARPGQGVPTGARRVAAGSPQSLRSGNGQGGATTRIVAGKALTHSGANANGSAGQAGQNGAGGNRNGPGNASTSGGQGNQGTGASANGRSAGNGHGAGSRQGNGTGGQAGAGLQPGQNKGGGGVMNPQQQALANLQNSISSAQQQGQRGNAAQGGSQGGAQGQLQGQNGRAGGGQSGTGNGAQGRQGQGRSTAGGSRGRQGQGRGTGSNTSPGNGTSGTGQGGGAGAGQGRAGPGSRRIGSTNGGYDGYGGRFGQYGPDSGANGGDSQGTSGSPAQTNRQGPARLADGSGVVLNGTQGGPQGKGNGLILTVGLPQQAPGSGSSVPTDTNSTTVNVPGYVAPDSNAVAPDERDVVRAYFSLHDSNN